MIRIDLHRMHSAEDFTSGYLKINGQFASYTLEDQHQLVKVSGETRIPAGEYNIVLRKELSPLTERYRNRFDWFDWHLMLEDVPNFKYILIHIGSDQSDTDGCILVGNSINSEGFLGSSTVAFKRIYESLSEALRKGEEARIYIHD